MGNATATSTDPAASVRARHAPPLDLVHLACQTLGNKELETEVLRMFLRQSRIQLQQIAAAHSPRELSAAAHQLIGSARAIGAWAVAASAEAIEQSAAADATDARELAPRLAALECAIAEANGFIGRLVD